MYLYAECVTDEVLTLSSTKFSTFTEMKLDDIRELAATVFSKSCVLDPLPSSIIKQCTDLLLPTITNIFNLPLPEGCMPTCLKSAVFLPLLKQPDVDFLQFKNFRPTSNLKAQSKIIEKSVALQLNNYLMNNNLHENFQSAYKVHHSTETVMVKVQDDILHAIDGNKVVVLLMLDLSTAFDTVSREIPLDRLSQRYGITGMIVNGLKLNEEKTELPLLSSRYRPSPSLEFVRVGGET